MSATSDWFDNLPIDEQETLHRIARGSILELDHCPKDYRVLMEILAWQQLEIDVMESHTDWLTATKANFARRSIPWTVGNLNQYPYLWGVDQ